MKIFRYLHSLTLMWMHWLTSTCLFTSISTDTSTCFLMLDASYISHLELSLTISNMN